MAQQIYDHLHNMPVTSLKRRAAPCPSIYRIALTILRILLIPVLVVVFYLPFHNHLVVAAVIFAPGRNH